MTEIVAAAATDVAAGAGDPIVYAGVVVSLVLGLASLAVQARNRQASAKKDEADSTESLVSAANQLYASYVKKTQQLESRLDSLEDEVTNLRHQLQKESEFRHKLRATVTYLLQIARQAVEYLRDSDLGDIDAIPEPLRSHVEGLLNLDVDDSGSLMNVSRRHD